MLWQCVHWNGVHKIYANILNFAFISECHSDPIHIVIGRLNRYSYNWYKCNDGIYENQSSRTKSDKLVPVAESTVGASVGVTVGPFEGSVVGDDVVGIAVAHVTFWVGSKDGLEVGSFVGSVVVEDGFSVGVDEGSIVGVDVSSSVAVWITNMKTLDFRENVTQMDATQILDNFGSSEALWTWGMHWLFSWSARVLTKYTRSWYWPEHVHPSVPGSIHMSVASSHFASYDDTVAFKSK